MKFMKHGKRSKLSCEDVNHSLKLTTNEIFYGYGFRGPLNYIRCGVKENELFQIEDKEMDLKDVIASPLPKCPRETSFQVHWLAIDGNVPLIPQNVDPEDVKKRAESTVPQATPESIPSVRHVLSPEMELYFKKVTGAVLAVKVDLDEVTPQSDKLTPATKAFFAVTRSLSADLGLYQIVPYFARFISENVGKSLRNVVRLKALMRMTKALLNNPNLAVELYLHQLMPAILTCIVGKQLCEDSLKDDHWSLREYAAQLVAFICDKYGKYFKDVQPRVVKTLLHSFLDPTKPLTTHYGAIKGLIGMGPRTIQLVLIPNVAGYIRLLDSKLKDTTDERVKEEGKHCWDTLLSISAYYLSTAAQYHKDIEQLLNTEANSENGKKTRREKEASKKRKLEHLEPAKDATIHQTIIFHELNAITARFEELYKVFGEALVAQIQDPSFYTRQIQPTES
eukprot:TRINITY_DN7007_c0_g1_i1.p1 TRINITY_DN7007_c0_g1~~TRINITY_DN7007_c0_g1_i1.p1  ORF type:complete len:502 (-),score=82.94 TRINITY_DN7007_c0_g1_i1:107-1459(-)